METSRCDTPPQETPASTATKSFRRPRRATLLVLAAASALTAAVPASAGSFSFFVKVGANPAALVTPGAQVQAQFVALFSTWKSSGASRKMSFNVFLTRNGIRDAARTNQMMLLYRSQGGR